MSFNIEYSLTLKKRKCITIVVHKDASVEVKAPLRTPQYIIDECIEKRREWILEKQAYFIEKNTQKVEIKYITGEKILYLGHLYTLNILPSTKTKIFLDDKVVRVYIKNVSKEHIKHNIALWYKQQMQEIVPDILEECKATFLQKMNLLGIEANTMGRNWYILEEIYFVLRAMKRRWGSITPSGKITLNTALIQAPKICLEYVIMHELCHLVEFNHSTRYYTILSHCMPEWKEHKNTLYAFF